MAVGRARIVEEAKRDPAGMELGLGPLHVVLGRMAGGDLIGELGLADVEEVAGQNPPLVPPGVGIDQLGRIAGRAQNDFGGL